MDSTWAPSMDTAITVCSYWQTVLQTQLFIVSRFPFHDSPYDIRLTHLTTHSFIRHIFKSRSWVFCLVDCCTPRCSPACPPRQQHATFSSIKITSILDAHMFITPQNRRTMFHPRDSVRAVLRDALHGWMNDQ